MVKPPRQILKTINRDENIFRIDIDGQRSGCRSRQQHMDLTPWDLTLQLSTHKPDSIQCELTSPARWEIL